MYYPVPVQELFGLPVSKFDPRINASPDAKPEARPIATYIGP